MKESKNLKKFKVSIKELWSKEEYDFTPWLQRNLDTISELTKLQLDYDKSTREKRVGRYEADIFVKDLSTDSMVVIENQFGQSDHKHLGQCLTYKANLDANIAIWVSESFTDEHLNAIRKLNEESDDQQMFFAISVQAYKIGEASYYDFNLEAYPSIMPANKEGKHYQFWAELKELLSSDLKDKLVPWGRPYMDFRLNTKGFFITLSVTRNISKVSLWTRDTKLVSKLDQAFENNNMGYFRTEGVKNKEYKTWKIENNSRENNSKENLEWMAKETEKLYHFYQEKIEQKR